MMLRSAITLITVALLTSTPLIADERESAAEIRQLVSARKLDDAQAALVMARETYPQSLVMAQLGLTLSSMYARENDMAKAQSVAKGTVEYITSMPLDSRMQAENYLASALTSNMLFSNETGNVDEAIALFDSAIDSVGMSPEMLGNLHDVKAVALARIGKGEEAQQVVMPRLSVARFAFEKDPSDNEARLLLAKVLSVKANVDRFLDSPTLETLTEATTLLSDEWVLENASNIDAIQSYFGIHQTFISDVSRTEPDRAMERIEALESVIAKLKENDDADAGIKRLYDQQERSLSSYKQRIATALKHQELIGQKAMPVMPESWVNGSPISPQELQGKVVLIDFWAVWCGPCIATFPHLREWHETYADQGLVILGVTDYYSYDWDDDLRRSTRVDELPRETERAAMEKFAEHHELKHRFAVMDDGGELKRFFAVRGIPQAVLIDRNGIIRMIKVGSGEPNAHELSEMIQKLIEQ